MSEEQQQMDQEAKVGHLFADGLLNRADSDDSSLSDLDESGQLEKNLHEEQLKNARMETEKAELKAENIRLQAEVKMMKMQKQMDEMKASNSEKLQQAQRRIAQLEVEKAYNELMSAQVRGLQKQLMQEKQEKATSYNAVYFRLMAAKQEKEELRNEFREKIQQQADKLAEHSIELSDLKKKERLNEWLSGIVLIRTGTFLRVAVNQHLDTSGHWSIHAGGLIAKKTAGKWAHVHADQPFPVPHAGPEDKLLYYFEVTITEMNGWCQDEAKTNRVAIGLCGTDFPFNSMNAFVDGSFAIQENGIYYASGTAKRHFGGFDKGDVVGCGLLVLPTGRRLFFTKNGDLWVKPILLGADEAKTNLHPIVSACGPGVEVEFNFGADLGAKPFKYELSQLDQVDT